MAAGGWSRAKWAWLASVVGLFVVISWWRGASLGPGVLGLVLLCFFCELLDSSLGMGYGTTLTPVLLACGYEPLQLVPSVLFSEFVSGFASSYFHHETGNVDLSHRSRESRIALLLALGSVVGVAVGVNLALQIPKSALKLLIGGIITAAGVTIWVFNKRTFAYRTWKMFLLASIASFNKALSGGGYGPLMTSGQMLSGVRGKGAVGITSFAEGFTCLVGVILFLGQGQRFDYDLLIPMVAGASLSIPFSSEFVKRMDEGRLKKTIAAFTIVLGLFTISKVIF